MSSVPDSPTPRPQVDEGGEGSANFHEVYTGPTTEFILQLTPGKVYKFRTRAVPVGGGASSPWSVIKGFSRSGAGMGVPEHVRGEVRDDGRTAVFEWGPPNGNTASAYQVKLDLQEGKKRRDEPNEYIRDDLSEGQHRFQVMSLTPHPQRACAK